MAADEPTKEPEQLKTQEEAAPVVVSAEDKPAVDAVKQEVAPPKTETLPAESDPNPLPEPQVIDHLRGHQELMIQWFQAVRGDVGILYQRLEKLAADWQQGAAGVSLPPPVAPPQSPAAPQPSAPTFADSAAAVFGNVFGSAAQPDAPSASAGGAHSAAGQSDAAARWEGLVFGPELAGQERIAKERRALIRGLMDEEPDALVLAGQLMIFRGSSGDRLPVLLKDLGEAYYRWNPQSAGGADPFRDTLGGWLQRQCERGGSVMKIELVRPGDRFDNKRHNAKDPGVEVTEVYGWVVLRDNGKVYTKANVAVQ